MASYIFGGKNLETGVQQDVSEVFKERTGKKPSVYSEGDVFLLSSGSEIDQGELKIAFNGYIVDCGSSPEQHIAELYREHGKDFVEYLDGQFRFILYDTGKDRFHVSADKAGKKVIYYTETSDFACSSHLTPLLRHPEIKVKLNKRAVSDLLQGWSASFAGGERLVKGVKRLYPSHRIIYNDEIFQDRFWDTGKQKRNISDQEAVERMDELLTEAAEKLVEQSEGPLNVMLSGGFDSTFLVALLREVTDRQIKSYTWGWEDKHFKSAREMSDLYNTDHTEIMNEYRFPTDEEMFFYEEPHNAFVRYPFRELYREHGVKSYWTGLNSQATFPVCLKNIRRLDRIRFSRDLVKKMPTSGLKRFVGSNISYKAKKGIEVLESDQDSTAAVIDWGIARSDGRDLVSPELREYRDLDELFDEKWQLGRGSFQENYNYLQLRVRDTARYAYYSQDMEHYDVYGYRPLIDFSYSLPMSQKKNRRLLQKLARDRVPDRIITKGASGWDFVSDRFRQTIEHNEEDYRQNIQDLVERELLDREGAERLLLPARFDQGTGETNQMIAAYLLERWMKLFIDRDEPWKPV